MTHTARIIGLIVAAALTRSAGAQEWAAAFPPAPECGAVVALSASLDSTAARAGVGTMVVRPIHFGSRAPAMHMRVILAPLGDSLVRPRGFAHDPDSSPTRVFRRLPAGRYVFSTLQMGYYPRTDTVAIRAGAADTVTVGVGYFLDQYRNTYNCRPRGFRRPGERACVTDPDETSFALAHARSFATPEGRKPFPMIPAFAATDIALVADEAVCERAGREYGRPGDPPRRVVVVRIGRLFMVYDPYEPLAAGEFNITTIFDSSWKVIVSLAG